MSVLVLLLPIRWCNIVVGPLANARNRVRDLSIAGLMVNGASLGERPITERTIGRSSSPHIHRRPRGAVSHLTSGPFTSFAP